jgi:PAS domain S-box-containing protein
MSKHRIGVGLTTTFLSLILTIAGIGYLGLKTAEDMRADAQSMVASQWQDVDLADEALTYSNRNVRINFEIMLTHERADEDLGALLKQRDENSRKISELLARLQTRVGSDRERQLLDAVFSMRAEYLASYRRATTMYLNGDPATARRLLLQDSLPRLTQYQLAWNDFARFQREEMNQRLAGTEARYNRDRGLLVKLLGAGLFLAIVIAVFVEMKILVEVHRRQKAEDGLRAANQSLELKVHQRTAELERSNSSLSTEIAERRVVEEKLQTKTAFLEAQTDSTVDGILVVDGGGKKILQNRRFRQMFKLPEQLVSQCDDQATFEYMVSKALHPKEFRDEVEYLYLHRDLTSRDEVEFKDGLVVDRYTAPVIGEDNRYYGRIWVFRDVSERKRNEEVVRRLSLAVEQSPVSIVITDLQANIIYVNRKFVEITGYAYDEVIGKNPRVLKSGQTTLETYKELWETIQGGKQWRGEFQNKKKNGELYWEDAVIQPIHDERGVISHFLALKEDTTERRNMQAQLERAQKLEAIGQLAAGIAHEINTPMQFIGDNARFVQESWPPFNQLAALAVSAQESQDPSSAIDQLLKHVRHSDLSDLKFCQVEIPKAIEQSLNGVARVSKIVQAMKQFSRPGSENKELLDINQAIEDTITVTRNEWKYVADVSTELDAAVGQIQCHVGEFNQVILSLLMNAAHAISQGGAPRTPPAKGAIVIRSRRDSSGVEISVQDDGCGIPVEIQSRIFDLFFTTKEVGKGTGQGLSLAHAIVVKRHGGRIWFETKVGKGTTFFVHLPAAQGEIQQATSS